MAVATSTRRKSSSSSFNKMRSGLRRLSHVGSPAASDGDSCILPQDMIIDTVPPPMSNKIALAAGRFWGTEKFVQKHFQERFPGSITSATVGFMSPYSSSSNDGQSASQHPPTYEDVCTGRSGNLEVLLVEVSDSSRYMEELLRFFFQFHDPTTKYRQGCDRGFQFASWILCDDDQQMEIANRVRSEVQELITFGILGSAYENSKVVTCISSSLQEFTPATVEHQHYLDKNPQALSPQRWYFAEWPEGCFGSDESSSSSFSSRSTLTCRAVSDTSSSSSASLCLSLLEDDLLDEHRQRMRTLKLIQKARERRERLRSVKAYFLSWCD